MEFLVFTKHDCIWCRKSKDLLNEYKIYFEEYIFGEDFTKEQLASQLGLKPTDKLLLPQIFVKTEVGITLIGGYNELEKYLDKQREI